MCWKQTETDRGYEKIVHGDKSARETPFGAADFLSSQPPKEKGSLG
jgi:hypothetical protein